MLQKQPLFIAEVSSNHNQNIIRAKEFIKCAKNIGCGAIKFQLFKIEKLFSPEILEKSEDHRNRKKWELPIEFIPELSFYAHEKGILFSCTPFYLEAVKELEPFVDFYKIASYELLWSDLIIKCAKTGKDIVISTGMATIDEIGNAINIFRKYSNAKITLLHTISGYPTPIHEANLKAIKTLRDIFKCEVGLSDHSVSKDVIIRAIYKWNASVIEFHLDLDTKGAEYAMGHCWLPEIMKNTIESIEKGFLSDGSGIKEPAPSEIQDREWRRDPSDGLRPFKKLRNYV